MTRGEKIRSEIKEALAEPLRNCDIGTVEEQAKRFDEFCYNHRSREKGCGDCPLLEGGPCCELAWTQMPYETVKTKENNYEY